MGISAQQVLDYQSKKKLLKTIGEFKSLGRELVTNFGLTDKEAIDILNNRNVVEILAKYEGI